MRKLLNKFLVGADPEFVVLKKTRVARIRPLPTPLEGIGDIGEDHGGRVLELHPIQTRGVYALVKRMHALFPTLKQKNGVDYWDSSDFKFKAGAVVTHDEAEDCLGGHVHFGFRAEDLQENDPETGRRTAERLNRFLKNLDKFTHCMEALDYLPKNESARRRQLGENQHTEYGKASSYRPSGRDNHLEYRTMASWLDSPELAFVCLTGAKLIGFDPLGEVPIPSTISKAKLLAFFEQYKEDTNALRCIEKVLPNMPKTDPTRDIRESWRGPIKF